ncbi:hypothetical protein [Thalassovita aquimarina]|uniref:Uncharacterized protein n=1 Tax=Thalassovita aquimarina TaxID=2785917 RepID=A0ABS5HNL8_9RHOB|nr:hypothetical protein [Thalassovita aquimarina]MBR9650509.1 hypothetical protein [Thalassovita aquimarina]
MQSDEKMFFGHCRGYLVAFGLALLIYLKQQYLRLLGVWNYLELPDNDDQMRLVQVRDFLNGQGWYDMVQHRAMPPEGLSIHWSRLVDMPLAGLELLFSLFTSDDRALALTAIVWPAMLFVVFLAVTGWAVSRVFGYVAASFAVIAASVTPMIASNVFSVGRVDHNNVQLICMLVVICSVIVPGPPVRRGIIAGLTAALSLAVGLETIVVLAMAGIVLTVQHVLDRPGATDQLMGYGIALGGAAPLLFLIQIDPALWAVPRCDQLSRPTLAITSAAMAFAVITYLGRESVRSVRGRLIMAMVMGAAILAALWPVLSPCREGPFSVLPPEIRDLILSRITESMSAIRMFNRDPGLATQLVLPQMLLAALLAWQLIRSPAGRTSAPAVLLVFVLMGLLGSFYQIRTVIWGLAAMPMAFGASMHWAVTTDWQRLRRSKPVVLLIVALLVLYPHLVTSNPVFGKALQLAGQPQSENQKLGRADQNCSRRDKLAGLNDLEPASILAPLNLGTKILLYTPHSIFAAPYHRAPEGYWNGTLAFSGTDMDMALRLRATLADYVLVCDGEVYGDKDSIGSRLARGETPPWLSPVDTGDGPIRLLRVNRAKLAPYVHGN